MIKRANKLTALLAAATTVASIAPAGVHAADYKRISSEDGTIYSAKAFKDGSYVVDGNIVDEDTDAVYYVKDGKYTELEDVNSGSTLELYGDHYLSVDNGDYFIDLNTGKVTDDDVEADTRDDLQLTIKKNLRNVDRYNVNGLPTISADNLLAGPKYGKVWYKVGGDVTIADGTNEGKPATIYTDIDGNYIDGDYNLGSIKVITTAGGTQKTSVIENNEDLVNAVSDSKVSASVSNTKVIGQDDNNIYRTATITVTANSSDVSIKSINGVNVATADSSVIQAVTEGTSYSFNVIQKISKAQASDEIDDAKYAKSVTNYMICDKDGKVSSDAKAFYEMANNDKVSVANGRLIAYTVSDSKITVASTGLKSKGALNYLDAESSVTENATAVDTDVNGNLYRLDNGYIYKFDNTDDWNKLYRVDGSMKNMSIYDSNDMVVWDKNNEVYSLVGFNSSTSDNNDSDNNDSNNSNNTVAPVVAGWNQAADGTYTYVNADGTTVKGWFQSPLSGKWFYMDPTTGVMQTGWVQSPYSGKWFYMDPTNGDMQTGWVQSPYSGKWFYMNPSNGDMMTGWIQSPLSGKWYYMGSDGAMVTNTTVNGYVLGADGAWVR